jgi:hypothetical protein
MKKTHNIAFGLAFAACLAFAAVGSAQVEAGGPDYPGGVGMYNSPNSEPGVTGMVASPNTMPGAPGMYPGAMMPGGAGMQPQMYPNNFNLGFDPNMIPGTYANGGGMNMPQGQQWGSGGGGTSPMLDLRQVVWGGMQGLPQDQRYSGAMNMASQNLGQLQQGMMSGSSPISQIRNAVRDSIMTSRVSDISRMGQSTFRPMIQPGAVQSMISQIQPWNFPIRFQSAMMPAMIPTVSAPIKQRQMAYMQSGIMNNGFPNVPLPAPAFGPYPYSNDGVWNGGSWVNPGMPNNGGGGMPNGGMWGGGMQQQW